MARISIVGTGYVGLTTGAALAHLGHTVSCIDVDDEKIERLQAGELPIYEPGLDVIVREGMRSGRLRFSNDYSDGLQDAQFVFLAVGTPPSADGRGADLHYVYAAAKSVARSLQAPAIIVDKSTVPVGTGNTVRRMLDALRPDLAPWAVVSNPEFLQEGSAVHNFLHPARIVVGSHEDRAAERVAALYQSLDCPIVITNLNSAEMIKYASNAFLATRISFINEVARVCDAMDADVSTVAVGMGLDPRIGPAFLEAGLGYGGSCFPKDVDALAHMASTAGIEPRLLRAVTEINDDQRRQIVNRIRERLQGLQGRTIALWGLTFKPDTDDMRESPGPDIARRMAAEGAYVRAVDPMADQHTVDLGPGSVVCATAHEAAMGADVVLVATAWSEFQSAHWPTVAYLMRGRLVVDGRNCLDPSTVADAGLEYLGVGRRSVEPVFASEALSA